jgi:hypothetical protein
VTSQIDLEPKDLDLANQKGLVRACARLLSVTGGELDRCLPHSDVPILTIVCSLFPTSAAVILGLDCLLVFQSWVSPSLALPHVW